MPTTTQDTLTFFTTRDLDHMPQLERLSQSDRHAMRVVSKVLPFRTNSYVVGELIDWDRVPEDPIFQLTFPQRGMLTSGAFDQVEQAMRDGSPTVLAATIDRVRRDLNPHPEGQITHNVPVLDGRPVPGIQHKYDQTCLVFPSAGQTCHAFCTYCFRWAQFVGIPDLKFATDRQMSFLDYIAHHDEITDVLLTGGDPMVMRADVLARYIEPLLRPEFDHIQTIRIGTKMLGYWPYRLLTDDDAADLLNLLARVTASGKHLAVMAHFSHWSELSTPAVEYAIGRLHDVGAVIRTQAPLIRHVNDDPSVWARMWNDQVRLGLIPYYMFVERDTGANHHFEVPLARALDIYGQAIAQGSGLARTARGPVMSAFPGKVVVEGVAEVGGQTCFVLSLLQARDAGWCKQPFFAEYDETATWLDELRPAFGAREFFFAPELRAMATQDGVDGDPHATPADLLTSASV